MEGLRARDSDERLVLYLITNKPSVHDVDYMSNEVDWLVKFVLESYLFFGFINWL